MNDDKLDKLLNRVDDILDTVDNTYKSMDKTIEHKVTAKAFKHFNQKYQSLLVILAAIGVHLTISLFFLNMIIEPMKNDIQYLTAIHPHPMAKEHVDMQNRKIDRSSVKKQEPAKTSKNKESAKEFESISKASL